MLFGVNYFFMLQIEGKSKLTLMTKPLATKLSRHLLKEHFYYATNFTPPLNPTPDNEQHFSA